MGPCSCRAWVPVRLSQAVEVVPDLLPAEPTQARVHALHRGCMLLLRAWRLPSGAGARGTPGKAARGGMGACQAGQAEGLWGHTREGSGVGGSLPTGCADAAGQGRVPPSRHSHAKGAAVE